MVRAYARGLRVWACAVDLKRVLPLAGVQALILACLLLVYACRWLLGRSI